MEIAGVLGRAEFRQALSHNELDRAVNEFSKQQLARQQLSDVEMRNVLNRAELRQAIQRGELARMDLGRAMLHQGFGKLVQNAEFRQDMASGNARNYIVQ